MRDAAPFPRDLNAGSRLVVGMWPNPEGVPRLLGIEPHLTLLDLCCGDGYFTAPLAKLVGGKVHAPTSTRR